MEKARKGRECANKSGGVGDSAGVGGGRRAGTH